MWLAGIVITILSGLVIAEACWIHVLLNRLLIQAGLRPTSFTDTLKRAEAPVEPVKARPIARIQVTS